MSWCDRRPAVARDQGLVLRVDLPLTSTTAGCGSTGDDDAGPGTWVVETLQSILGYSAAHLLFVGFRTTAMWLAETDLASNRHLLELTPSCAGIRALSIVHSKLSSSLWKGNIDEDNMAAWDITIQVSSDKNISLRLA